MPLPVSDLIVPLAAVSHCQPARVGSKGAHLARLLAAGFAVPSGFCVTTAAYRAFLASARLESGDPIGSGGDDLRPDRPGEGLGLFQAQGPSAFEFKDLTGDPRVQSEGSTPTGKTRGDLGLAGSGAGEKQ